MNSRTNGDWPAPVLIAVAGTLFFTSLLWFDKLTEGTYAILMLATVLASLFVRFSSRVRELDLKNLKLTLVEEVRKEIRDDVVDMYVDLEKLRSAPFALGGTEMKELGLEPGGIVTAGAVMRYNAGVVKRERERLARIFANDKSPLGLAQAILDGSLDEKVFKWNGPEQSLDAEPISVEDRGKRKET